MDAAAPRLLPRYRTIALDNRGAGRSDKPFGRYDLEEMADDAVAVLDAAGVDRAHVMGASMGGAIAQLVALRHPERVQSLILACTACSNHQWRRELLSEWAAIANERGMGEMAKRAAHWVMAPRSVRRFWPVVGWFGPLAHGPARARLRRRRSGPSSTRRSRWPTCWPPSPCRRSWWSATRTSSRLAATARSWPSASRGPSWS